MDFRISRDARQHYGFDDSLFSTTGDVVLADPAASRRFAMRMVLAGGSRPERPVHAGDIDAIALIHEVMHRALAVSGRLRGPAARPYGNAMTYRFLAAVLVAVAMVTQACAQAPDRLQKILAAGVLRVGTTMDTPVFSMRNAEGKLEGIDIDLLETLGPALGVRIQYVKMSFGSMLSDLAADKFDVAMSGMGRTYERARVATFFRGPICATAS